MFFTNLFSALGVKLYKQCCNDILMVLAGGIKRVPAKFHDNGLIIDKLINEIHALQKLVCRGPVIEGGRITWFITLGISMVTCHW